MTTTQLSFSEEHGQRPQQQLLHFALAAMILSQGLQISSGHFNLYALYVLTLSFLFCVTAVARLYFSISEEYCERLTLGVLIGGIVVQFGQLLMRFPDVNVAWVYIDYLLYLFGVAFAGLLAVIIFVFRPEFRRFGFPILLIIHFLLGVWIIKHSPNYPIDVLVIQTDAANALLNGQNPYTLTFPDIYQGKLSYYGEGLSVGGRLLFGYVYPPLCVFMAIPGLLLGGDVRYSNLVCITLSGALLAYARPSQWSFLAATFFLFMPRVFDVLLSCWTEAFVILFFSLTLLAACRMPRLTPIAFGLLLAVKQHLFLCAPLAILMIDRTQNRRKISRFFAIAVLVALAVSLPLALWNFEAFKQYAILLNFQMPFRKDSLNFSAMWAHETGVEPSSLIGFFLLIPTYYICLRRCVATPAGFAGATALMYFVFFLFGRQAFLNYYYFIFAMMCGAIATTAFSPNHANISETSFTRTI